MALPLTPIDDPGVAASVQQHIHQTLCSIGTTGLQKPSPCRCDDTVSKTLNCIKSFSERNTALCKKQDRTASKSTICIIKQMQSSSACSSSGSSSYFMTPHSCIKSTPNWEQDCKPFHSSMLIGYLTDTSQDGSKKGLLYFKDQTGIVPCQVSSCDMSWLGSVIVLYCWNYISDQSDSSYLEVCCQCKPDVIPLADGIATDITGWSMENRQMTTHWEDIMTVPQAHQLLLDRSQEDVKKTLLYVTINGLVTAKSPLYRVRGTPFFFVELGCDSSDGVVTILSKDPDTTYLHHLLHMGKVYTITNLLPTTINKGTRSPHPVLLCQAKTYVAEVRSATCGRAFTPTISGSVMNCVNSEAGVFELEGHVMLYACYMLDGSKQYQRYRVGTKIAVYNAHDLMLGKPPKRCIVCCLRSTIVITEYPQQGLDTDKIPSGSNKSVLHLILKLNLTPSRLHWLGSVCPVLQKKLGSAIYSKKPETSVIWRLLTTPSPSHSKPWITPAKRYVYEEFLSHDTQPCVAAKSAQDNVQFCHFPCISDVPNLLSPDEGVQHSHVVSDSKHWKCKCIASINLTTPMVLVGYLETNVSTGQLLLEDKTGSIQCLVTNTQTPFNYSKLEDSTDESSDSIPPILPSLLDQVIRVDRFLIIKEEFVHHEENGLSSTSAILTTSEEDTSPILKQDWSCVYVVFDFNDVVTLCQAATLKTSKKPVKRTAAGAALQQPELGIDKTRKSAIFSVKGKSRLQCESTESTMSFSVDADYINTWEDDKDSKNLATNSLGSVKSKPAVLQFTKLAVKWFPVLIPGCVYHLSLESSCPASESVLLPTIESSSKTSLANVIRMSGSAQVMTVSQYAKLNMLKVDEIPPAFAEGYHQIQANVKSACKLSSITQVVQTKSGAYDNVVSFWGRIVSGHYATAKATRSHQTQTDWQMKLLVSDPEASDSESAIRVYTSVVTPALYPVGLIPGSIVVFRRCIRVKSVKGTDSFQVGPLTDITIEHVPFHEANKLGEPVKSSLGWPSCGRQLFIAELCTKPPDSTTQFTVNAHVIMIHFLVLGWSCDTCGRQECICASGASHDDVTQGQVTVQAKFSIDDGSGEAIVWCHDTSSVAPLLGLKPSQWNQLTKLLPRFGKVVYRYSKDAQDVTPPSQLSDNDLEGVVSTVCSHGSIQKRVQLKCRMIHSMSQSTKNATATDTAEHSGSSRKMFIPWPHLKCLQLLIL